MVAWNTDTFVSLISIFTLMLSLSSTIDLQVFKERIRKPKGIIIGLFCQFGIVPVTAYILSLIFSLQPALAVALIIIGTCPGGAMSNFWCFVFNGDLPLSIAMTTASSILSFAFISMNGAIYIPLVTNNESQISLDFGSLALSVSAVLLGIVCGILITHIFERTPLLNKSLSILGTVSILFILVWALVDTNDSDAKLRYDFI